MRHGFSHGVQISFELSGDSIYSFIPSAPRKEINKPFSLCTKRRTGDDPIVEHFLAQSINGRKGASKGKNDLALNFIAIFSMVFLDHLSSGFSLLSLNSLLFLNTSQKRVLSVLLAKGFSLLSKHYQTHLG